MINRILLSFIPIVIVTILYLIIELILYYRHCKFSKLKLTLRGYIEWIKGLL